MKLKDILERRNCEGSWLPEVPHPLVITGHSSTAGQPDEPVAAFILVNTHTHIHTDTDKHTHTHTHRQTHTFVWRREQMEIEAMTLTMEIGVQCS